MDLLCLENAGISLLFAPRRNLYTRTLIRGPLVRRGTLPPILVCPTHGVGRIRVHYVRPVTCWNVHDAYTHLLPSTRCIHHSALTLLLRCAPDYPESVLLRLRRGLSDDFFSSRAYLRSDNVARKHVEFQYANPANEIPALVTTHVAKSKAENIQLVVGSNSWIQISEKKKTHTFRDRIDCDVMR